MLLRGYTMSKMEFAFTLPSIAQFRSNAEVNLDKEKTPTYLTMTAQHPFFTFLSQHYTLWADANQFAVLPVDYMNTILEENKKLRGENEVLSSPNIIRVMKQGKQFKGGISSYEELIKKHPDLDI